MNNKRLSSEDRILKLLEDYPGVYCENELAIRAFAPNVKVSEILKKYNLEDKIKRLPTPNEYLIEMIENKGANSVSIINVCNATGLSAKTVYAKRSIYKYGDKIVVPKMVLGYVSNTLSIDDILTDIKGVSSVDSLIKYEMSKIMDVAPNPVMKYEYIDKLYALYDVLIEKYKVYPFSLNAPYITKYFSINGYIPNRLWLIQLISTTIVENRGKYNIDTLIKMFRYNLVALRMALRKNDIMSCVDGSRRKTKTAVPVNFIFNNIGKYTVEEVADMFEVSTSNLLRLRKFGTIPMDSFRVKRREMNGPTQEKCKTLLESSDRKYRKSELKTMFKMSALQLDVLFNRHPELLEKIDFTKRAPKTIPTNDLMYLVLNADRYIELIKNSNTLLNLGEVSKLLTCKSPVSKGFLSAFNLWDKVSVEPSENMYSKFINNGLLAEIATATPLKALAIMKQNMIAHGTAYAYCINNNLKEHMDVIYKSYSNKRSKDFKVGIYNIILELHEQYNVTELGVLAMTSSKMVKTVAKEFNVTDKIHSKSSCLCEIHELYNEIKSLDSDRYYELNYHPTVIEFHLNRLKSLGIKPRTVKEVKIKLRLPKPKKEKTILPDKSVVHLISENPTIYNTKELKSITGRKVGEIWKIANSNGLGHLIRENTPKDMLHIEDVIALIKSTGIKDYSELTKIMLIFGGTVKMSAFKEALKSIE